MAQAKDFNASNPKHVRSRAEQEKRQAAQEQDAYEYVMNSPIGRHFVWLLLGDSGVFEQSFTGNNTTFFNCGRRDVGLKLQVKLEEKTPIQFLEMWREHLAKQQDLKAEDAAVRTAAASESEEGHG